MRGRGVTAGRPVRGSQDGSDRVRVGDSVADDDDATKPSRGILRKLQHAWSLVSSPVLRKHPMGPLERSTLPRRRRLILRYEVI
jgi:hypothetical protein